MGIFKFLFIFVYSCGGFMKKLKTGIGKNISDCREDMDLTIEELAAKMNVSKNTISRWELNHNIPNAEDIRKLSHIFGVSCDRIITGTDTPNRTLVEELGLSNDSIERLKSKQSKAFGFEAKAINLLLTPYYRGLLFSLYKYLHTNFRESHVTTTQGIKRFFPPMVFPPLLPSDEDGKIAYSIGDQIDTLMERDEHKNMIEKAMLLNLMNEISNAKEEVYKKALPVNMTFETGAKDDETSER